MSDIKIDKINKPNNLLSSNNNNKKYDFYNKNNNTELEIIDKNNSIHSLNYLNSSNKNIKKKNHKD